jgi:hypothetical protein
MKNTYTVWSPLISLISVHMLTANYKSKWLSTEQDPYSNLITFIVEKVDSQGCKVKKKALTVTGLGGL